MPPDLLRVIDVLTTACAAFVWLNVLWAWLLERDRSGRV